MTSYCLEIFYDGAWTDDASLMGHGLSQDQNTFESLPEAQRAFSELVGVGFSPKKLRVRAREAPCGGNVPTIESAMARRSGPCETFFFDTEGGRIFIPGDVLRSALEGAYDPTDPSWEAFIVLPEECEGGEG
jgi:hypothetical protein